MGRHKTRHYKPIASYEVKVKVSGTDLAKLVQLGFANNTTVESLGTALLEVVASCYPEPDRISEMWAEFYLSKSAIQVLKSRMVPHETIKEFETLYSYGGALDAARKVALAGLAKAEEQRKLKLARSVRKMRPGYEGPKPRWQRRYGLKTEEE